MSKYSCCFPTTTKAAPPQIPHPAIMSFSFGAFSPCHYNWMQGWRFMAASISTFWIHYIARKLLLYLFREKNENHHRQDAFWHFTLFLTKVMKKLQYHWIAAPSIIQTYFAISPFTKSVVIKPAGPDCVFIKSISSVEHGITRVWLRCSWWIKLVCYYIKRFCFCYSSPNSIQIWL